MPGRERGKYLYRIARIAPGEGARTRRARNDGRRQADQGIARLRSAAGRRAFLLPRGLGGQTRLRLPRARTPRPLGVCGQIIPWNFPLLMVAWKLAPALACGNTVRAQARRDHAASPRCSSRRSSQEAELPPGVVNIVTGAGETGARARRASRTWTRSRSPARTEVGKLHREGARRHEARSSRSNSAARRRNIVFDDAPIDQAVEGIVNGIFFNQGHVCCAGSRLLVQEGICPTPSLRKLRDRIADAARRRSAGQEHRHRRDQFEARSSRRSASSWRPASREGGELIQHAVRAARRAATGSRRASSPASPRATASRGGNLRPGAERA